MTPLERESHLLSLRQALEEMEPLPSEWRPAVIEALTPLHRAVGEALIRLGANGLRAKAWYSAETGYLLLAVLDRPSPGAASEAEPEPMGGRRGGL